MEPEKVTDPLPKFCPVHPEPLPLPSPLPDPITDALTNLSSYFKGLINEISAVSVLTLLYVIHMV